MGVPLFDPCDAASSDAGSFQIYGKTEAGYAGYLGIAGG